MDIQKLINENINLVYYIVHKYYPTFVDDEDIIQCGMLGLCRAANTWDETKSVFSTYASMCILNEIKMEFRKRKKHKGVLSLEYEYDDTKDSIVELKDMIIGDEDVDYVDVHSIYNQFTPFEKKIFDYRKMGVTGVEIANKLGCSKQMISKTLRKMKRKWKFINGDD